MKLVVTKFSAFQSFQLARVSDSNNPISKVSFVQFLIKNVVFLSITQEVSVVKIIDITIKILPFIFMFKVLLFELVCFSCRKVSCGTIIIVILLI